MSVSYSWAKVGIATTTAKATRSSLMFMSDVGQRKATYLELPQLTGKATSEHDTDLWILRARILGIRFGPVIYMASNEAKRTAKAVESRFTALLVSHPRPSKVAPSRLSNNIPKAPATTAITAKRTSRSFVATASHPTSTAAAIPKTVPGRLIAPSVPAGTFLHDVTTRALWARALPVSLDTVSQAASAKAARLAVSRGTRHGVRYASAPAKAASPTLANTCAPSRPLARSAIASCRLRPRPNRVAK